MVRTKIYTGQEYSKYLNGMEFSCWFVEETVNYLCSKTVPVYDVSSPNKTYEYWLFNIKLSQN